jgi:hypothetical protein
MTRINTNLDVSAFARNVDGLVGCLRRLAELGAEVLQPVDQSEPFGSRNVAAGQLHYVADDCADPLRVGANDLGEAMLIGAKVG